MTSLIDITSLVVRLEAEGACVGVDGDRLVVAPPPDRLMEEAALLRAHRDEVRRLLGQRQDLACRMARTEAYLADPPVDTLDDDVVVAVWRMAAVTGEALVARRLVALARDAPLAQVLADPNARLLAHVDDGRLGGWRNAVAVLLAATSWCASRHPSP